MAWPVRRRAEPPARPPFDPLVREGDPLPRGTRVRLLTGRSRREQREVRGRLVGYAIRSRTRIDVQVDEIETFAVGDERADRLPAAMRATFEAKVQSASTISSTLAHLAGRGEGEAEPLVVDEIRFQTCWGCGRRMMPYEIFCPDCGNRVLAGAPPGASPVRPDDLRPACVWCGEATSPQQDFCGRCGRETATDSALGSLDGLAVVLDARGLGDQAVVRVGGRIERAQSRPAGLYDATTVRLTLGDLRVAGAGDRSDAESPDAFDVSPGAIVRFDVRAPTRQVRSLLDAAERGEVLEGVEVDGGCASCVIREGGARHCGDCGKRVRLFAPSTGPDAFPHADPETMLIHGCGTKVPAGSAFCPVCGGEMEREGGQGRFARLL